MTQNLNPVLYVMGLFDKPVINPALKGNVASIQQSGFTTVIQGFLHSDQYGNFYNYDQSNPVVLNGELMPANGSTGMDWSLFQSMKGGSVGKLLYSLGDGGLEQSGEDFMNMGALVTDPNNPNANLLANFRALQTIFDGIDFDLEPQGKYTYDNALKQAVINLTLVLGSIGMEVTYCPYMQSSWWFDCLAGVYAVAGKQLTTWMNVQCYDGGSGNTPGEWVAALEEYQQTTNAGVADPAGFIVPGYWTNDSPSTVQNALANSNDPGINGSFIWQYAACESTVDAYATAVITGLQQANS